MQATIERMIAYRQLRLAFPHQDALTRLDRIAQRYPRLAGFAYTSMWARLKGEKTWRLDPCRTQSDIEEVIQVARWALERRQQIVTHAHVSRWRRDDVEICVRNFKTQLIAAPA